ncbi:Long-chain-fatty-acid-CoA ligase 1 [Smittium culicis]|uniref:Long-chain-fatty-acid-CoA ligase 1 n=1 Tax=Smittium culicis TaxID=133412 RepID=A0A1R1YCB5_9FUNG|nr:Long-chain-fatty-acid-CoA ligase 1 [Smittium culicis]
MATPNYAPTFQDLKDCTQWVVDQFPSSAPNESPIKRSIVSPEALTNKTRSGMNTIFQIIENSAKNNADKNLFGHRTIIDKIIETKKIKKAGSENSFVEKKWEYYHLSEYKWSTYKQGFDLSLNLASGLASLGLIANDRIMIYSHTCPEWMQVFIAAISQSIQVATSYDTLKVSGLQHAISQTQSKLLLIPSERLKTAIQISESNSIPSLTSILYFGDQIPDPDTISTLKSKFKNVISLSELQQIGIASPVKPNPPKPDDVAVIMYTSGSTGEPKGAIIKHSNIASICGGLEPILEIFTDGNDTLLCYLPLAHVLELMVEILAIQMGLALGYGTSKTLTSDSVRNCKGDMEELKPTIMIGVPLVWSSVRNGILTKLGKLSYLKQSIFNTCASTLSPIMKRFGVSTYLLDNFVFRQVKAVTGGRLKFAITGGAPLPIETQQLLSTVLCPIIQGYGMTESGGLISVQLPNNYTLGTVGALVPSTELKLIDVEGTNYKAKNNCGEICIRGPSVFSGYLNDPEKTSEVLSSDGWFRTGDIGTFLENGELSIIDRIKNIVKLANGEYIAIEKLESLYKLSLFVHEIYVFADPTLNQPFAIISINSSYLSQFAKSNDIPFTDISELTSNDSIIKSVAQDLARVADSNQLLKQERLLKFHLDHTQWTPENSFLTSANKLKRPVISEHYKDIIANLIK